MLEGPHQFGSLSVLPTPGWRGTLGEALPNWDSMAQLIH